MSTEPRISKAQICVMMLLHGFAIGLYLIPLPLVMKAHGLEKWVVLPFVISSASTFISPLIFGSLADRRFAPERLFGVVVLGAAALLALLYVVVQQQWGLGWYVLAACCYHLWAAPGWGLLNTIGLMHLKDPKTEFGPLRVFATIGFMLGGASMGWAKLDESCLTGWLAAGLFVVEGLFLLKLPPSRPQLEQKAATWRTVLGWDAFDLLRDSNHRAIYLTSAAFNVALCAFYLYTPLHLATLGDTAPSSTMALAQIMEIFSMLGLALLLKRFRLKWLLMMGLLLGAVRYALYLLNSSWALAVGILCHGLIFTLFFMTTQIYVEERIDSTRRNQAQALLTLMINGVGSLIGYSFYYWWYDSRFVNTAEGRNWSVFWLPPLILILITAGIFCLRYRSKVSPAEAAK
jgi:MFS family permease